MFSLLIFSVRIGPVEVAAVCMMVSSMMNHVGFQNILLRQVCAVEFNYYEGDNCEHIVKQRGDLQIDTDPIYQSIDGLLRIRSLINGVVPIFVLIPMGSYIDRRGRKLILALPFVGYIVQPASILFMSQLTNINGLWMTVISALIRSLSGSELAFVMAGYSYVGFANDKHTLSTKLNVLEASYSCGLPIAFVLQSVYYINSVDEIFTIGTGMIFAILGLICIIYQFDDPPHVDMRLDSSSNCSIMTGVVSTMTRPRIGDRRLQMWLLLVAYVCISGPLTGEFPLMYRFFTERLDWDVGTFSKFQQYTNVTKIIGGFWVFSLMRKYMTDAGAAFISGMGQLASCMFYAFSYTWYLMGLGATLDLMNYSIAATIRSIMTTKVEKCEIGRLNSFVAILSSMLPLWLSPLYNYLYKETLKSLPGAFYILSAGITVPALVVLGWVWVKERKGEEGDDDLGDVELRGVIAISNPDS